MSGLVRRAPRTIAFSILLLLPLVAATAADAHLSLIGSWPTMGSPLGIAIEPPGTVLLSTPSAIPPLLRYSPDGTFIAHVGPSINYTVTVYGIAVNSINGDIFFAMYTPGNFYISHLGSFGSAFGGPWGGAISSDYIGLYNYETACAYGVPCADVYVTDPIGNLVVWFKSSSSGGIGDYYAGVWSSNHPTGIATLGAVVCVASRDGGTITRYTTSGTVLNSFTTGAMAAEGLAAGPDGLLYLADRGNGAPGSSRLLVFSAQGALVDSVGSVVSGYGYGPAEYVGIAVGRDGTVFAGDYRNGRVMKFSPSNATAAKPATWGRLKAMYR